MDQRQRSTFLHSHQKPSYALTLFLTEPRRTVLLIPDTGIRYHWRVPFQEGQSFPQVLFRDILAGSQEEVCRRFLSAFWENFTIQVINPKHPHLIREIQAKFLCRYGNASLPDGLALKIEPYLSLALEAKWEELMTRLPRLKRLQPPTKFPSTFSFFKR